MVPNHFTLNYIYREYHLTGDDVKHSAPSKMPGKLFRIHNSENVLGLVLAFYVSFALGARKTAHILQSMFDLKVSYQTVLNYAKQAAYHCHSFNLSQKGPVDDIAAGDETYIKIRGKNWYIFFFMAPDKRTITAYHLANNRGTIPAIAAINEAIRTADSNQDIRLVTDGNPSYTTALLYLNKDKELKDKIKHSQVIGLQNLDEESAEYRAFKQIIERLNRTYKYHVKPAVGFSSINGAMALTTLFVTFYNFLRPHSSLGYKPPIQIPGLNEVKTIQQKWIKILKMAL